MTTNRQLYYLISEYEKGKYCTRDFCELFSDCYYHGEPDLSEETELWFGNLAQRCARFSEFEEDLALENIYFSEDEIKKFLVEMPAFYKYVDNENVKIELSKAEALVLFDMASKMNKSKDLHCGDGDKQLFWTLENLLESELVEIFYENYEELVKAARKMVVEKCGRVEIKKNND